MPSQKPVGGGVRKGRVVSVQLRVGDIVGQIPLDWPIARRRDGPGGRSHFELKGDSHSGHRFARLDVGI
jgi:hypothetical protein